MWHKDVSIAVLNCNTSYHENFGCELSRVFHGGIRYIVRDLKTGYLQRKVPKPYPENVQDVLERPEEFFKVVRKNAMQAYIKYKA